MGREKHRDVHDERDQGPEGDMLVNDALSAVPHQQARAGSGDDVGHREVDGVVQDRADVGAGVLLVDGLELPALAAFVGENLHHVHPRQVLLHERVERGHRRAHLLKRRLHFLLEHVGAQQHQRERGQAHERELPVEPEHIGEDEHELQNVAHHRRQPFGKHIRKRLHVGHRARDQHPDGRTIEERQPQAEQVAVEADADVAHHLLTEPAAEVGLQVAHDGVRQQQHAEPDEHPVEAVGVAAQNLLIYYPLNQKRPHGSQHRRGEGQEDGESVDARVGPHELKQAAQHAPIEGRADWTTSNGGGRGGVSSHENKFRPKDGACLRLRNASAYFCPTFRFGVARVPSPNGIVCGMLAQLV